MPSPPRYQFQNLPQLPVIDIGNIPKENIAVFLCPYCDESLPNPLPEELKNKLNNLQKQKRIMEDDRQSFCFMHKAILQLIPNGTSKGYPLFIDFFQIPSRINRFKEELVNIINNSARSYYRDIATTIYKDIGFHKAKTPMILINRCESFQVKFFIQINYILLTI